MPGRPRSTAPVAAALVLTALLSLFAACKLDDFLFNRKKLSSYSLSSNVIPDSMRTFVSLSSRGNRIYGFYVKSSGAHPDGTILYCHGNLESIEPYWERVELLYRAGYNVFIFDYEGYGMSEGECSEEALYADGRAALAYIRSRPDVNQAHVVFYGWSLGAVVAIDLAARASTPRVLVCESPFASGEALVQSGTLIDIPGDIVLKGEYDNAARIREVHAPFLLFHGTDDRFIDITKNGEVIFNNANEPKEFIRVPGAGHTTVPWTMGADAYIKAVAGFIEAH